MINWEPYDLLDEFLLFDAACLWLEIEPSQEIKNEMPGNVRNMMRAVESHVPDSLFEFGIENSP